MTFVVLVLFEKVSAGRIDNKNKKMNKDFISSFSKSNY